MIRIHKEGKKIIVINVILWTLVAIAFWCFNDNLSTKIIMTAVCVYCSVFMLRFFRVPDREVHVDDSLVMSPGDGKVVQIRDVEENEFFKGPCKQVSVFLTFFNIHITWFPVGGTISYYKYHPGKYLFAFLPKSSEKNEHTTIGVRTSDGHDVMFRQIAGIVARRVVCYAKEGAPAIQSSEAGFIKFGSRLDIFLPPGTEVLVHKGDKVRGQISPIAKFNKSVEKQL